jgi:hypothetical protein
LGTAVFEDEGTTFFRNFGKIADDMSHAKELLCSVNLLGETQISRRWLEFVLVLSDSIVFCVQLNVNFSDTVFFFGIYLSSDFLCGHDDWKAALISCSDKEAPNLVHPLNLGYFLL